MDLQLNAEQKAFRDEVRRYIDERISPSLRECMKKGHRPAREDIVAWQRLLHERGWAAPHWPREYGGADLGQIERLILLDEIARTPAPRPLGFNVTMLGPVLLQFGTEAQKREWLPKLANLDAWFCQGFSEPGAGSDLASLRTRAHREGDHYIVNGQKIWTTYAHWADYIFCLVRTEQGVRKQDGISFLLIDMHSPGVTVRPIVTIDGEHHLNEVFFDEVKVPAANLIGEEGKGWKVTKFLLANERTGIADVGTTRERLDYARELASRLTQAGQPLIDDPKVRTELAWLDAELRALEITNWRMLLSASAQAENPAFASVLKLKGVEIQQALTDLTLRMMGPLGIVRESGRREGEGEWWSAPAVRYFYSRASSIYGGSSEVQKDILSKNIVG